MVKIKKINSQQKENLKKPFKSKDKIKKIPKNEQVKKEMTKFTEKVNFPQEKLVDLTEIKSEIIQKALKGILQFHSENPKLKNQLFNEQYPVFLQITCFKVPKGNSKIFRIPLKHSLYNEESEICLIVSEVKGIQNSEYDQHKEHYEELLSKKGVDNIKNIMTFHEFRTSYETFEQKNRLVDLYDVFLADSKISGKVVKKCGKIFYKKRKVPAAVKLQVSKLKEHINKTLSKTFFHMHLQGNCSTLQVGHSKMTISQLKENVQNVQHFLESDFPGGFDNVMGITIFAPRAPSVPIYCSVKSGKEVEVPRIESKKPKAFKTFRDELTTLPNADVIVKPSGDVIVRKTKNELNEVQNVEEVPPIVVNKIKKKIKSKTKRKRELETPIKLQKKNTMKKKKLVLTIESGKIEEELVVDKLHLGDQGRKIKTKSKDVKQLKIKPLKKNAKLKNNKLLKSEEPTVKKQKIMKKRSKV